LSKLQCCPHECRGCGVLHEHEVPEASPPDWYFQHCLLCALKAAQTIRDNGGKINAWETEVVTPSAREPGRETILEETPQSESEELSQRRTEDELAFAVGTESDYRQVRGTLSLAYQAADEYSESLSY
jgi:hypothetical protein